MFEELKEQYRQTLPEKISTIKALLQDIRDARPDTDQRLRHIAHTLHGSGSTFGYPEISSAAKTVEHAAPGDLLKELANLIRVLVTATHIEEAVARPGILIIDDDADITGLLATLLRKKCPEYPLVVAANGLEANKLLATGSFVLIVLDLLLPDTDGRTLLGQIHDSRHRGTPVFVLSGVDQAPVRDECLALGAKQFIAKPFKPERIAEVIADELGGKGPAAFVEIPGQARMIVRAETNLQTLALLQSLVAALKKPGGSER